jgi:hypothetical protein
MAGSFLIVRANGSHRQALYQSNAMQKWFQEILNFRIIFGMRASIAIERIACRCEGDAG